MGIVISSGLDAFTIPPSGAVPSFVAGQRMTSEDLSIAVTTGWTASRAFLLNSVSGLAMTDYVAFFNGMFQKALEEQRDSRVL